MSAAEHCQFCSTLTIEGFPLRHKDHPGRCPECGAVVLDENNQPTTPKGVNKHDRQKKSSRWGFSKTPRS